MIQVKTFDDVDDLNKFLATLSEAHVKKIEWKVIEEDSESYTEYFLVVYKIVE